MSRKKTIKNYLEDIIPKDKFNLINRSFEIVGDIAICEIDEQLIQYEKQIAEAIMKINSSIKTVLKKQGIHGGEFRTQQLIHIGGENKKQTIYQENGIKLQINPETVYFSARLSTEREQLMNNLKPNKKILIMFSGAGPYTYVALKKQPNLLNITSIEINKQGHELAIQSLELNKNLLKKSNIYKNIIQYLKQNQIPIYEKIIIKNLNSLKINFINGDVKKEVKKLNLKKYKKQITNFHNQLLKQQSKDLFNFFKQFNEQNIFLNLDEKIEKKKLIVFLILFKELNFICKINNQNYIFDNNLLKGYLLNYLETNNEINKINLYDEIYMPLPKDAELFLESAFEIANKNCIIHMYDFIHENEFPIKSEKAIKQASIKFNKKIKIIQTRKVGQYSPRKYRVCCDFQILD